MSNFLKKKAKHQAGSGEDADGLGASHQRFLNKFGKKKVAVEDTSADNAFDNPSNTFRDSSSDPIYDKAHRGPDHLNQPDYYSPPTSVPLAEEDFTHTSYNTSNWYSLNGRIGRIQLLAFGVIWGLITTLLYIIGTLLGSVLGPGAVSLILAIISIFTLPAAIYSYILLPRRRLHDIGKSGWWLLLLIVPLVNLLLLLYMYFARGDDGVNAYGLPPAPYTQTEFWLALLLPIMAVIGIVAAILLPNLLDDSLLSQMAPMEDTVIVEGSDADTTVATPSETPPAADPADAVVAPVTEDPATENPSTNSAADASADGPQINVVEQPVIDTQAPISFEEFKQEAQTTIYREEAEAEPAQ